MMPEYRHRSSSRLMEEIMEDQQQQSSGAALSSRIQSHNSSNNNNCSTTITGTTADFETFSVHAKPLTVVDSLMVTCSPYRALASPDVACMGCGQSITERYLLKVSDEFWHESCLRCCFCGGTLGTSPTCFVRDGKVFCKNDYKRIYGTKCGRCLLPLNANDLIFRSLSNVFHIGCFACAYCGLLLQKGDQYLYHEGQIVCRRDYDLLMQQHYGPGGILDHDDARKGPKRPRTILTSSQRKAFKASFEISSKPCRKVREALAKETGLSVRVVQVWFQNQRAKMKKVQRKIDQGKGDSKRTTKGSNGSEGSRSKKTSESNSDAKSDIGDGSSLDDLDTSSIGSVASSPSYSESDITKLASTPEGSSSRNQSYDHDSTPIDKLYSMQTTYFNF